MQFKQRAGGLAWLRYRLDMAGFEGSNPFRPIPISVLSTWFYILYGEYSFEKTKTIEDSELGSWKLFLNAMVYQVTRNRTTREFQMDIVMNWILFRVVLGFS